MALKPKPPRSNWRRNRRKALSQNRAAVQAAGDRIYWDNTAKNTTKTLTSNTLIGVATEAVAGGATDLIGRVRLNGAF